MKILQIILVSIIALSINFSCSSHAKQEENTITESKSETVQIYYFHGTRRCATCMAIEAVTKEVVNEINDENVTFKSINRDENKDNPLIKKYEISVTSLIIVNGDEVINLTNDAFMNARTNPEKLKEKIRTTINSML